MTDRFFFPLAAAAAVSLIALAAVFPQGIGARSPGPFGHETAAHLAARTAPKAPPKADAPAAKIQLGGSE